ncbi:efflux RND transporter periplasmic adaptor subunit [Pseudidiomarina sp. CB1]|uniref:efflux RND transporter periplasmic adaptor subunit n=1 Tax=Pseudidiomarina sp. CB1 TaxID=2972484 RepID=UPI002163CFAE|nr:efflux RND transporter periplasmic adaptor subunit [Pseudidiomarina sp. CB1]
MRLMTTLTSLFVVALLAACSPTDEAAHGHAHDEAEPLVYTHYTEATELFVEFPPLQQGKDARFLAHFTYLDKFAPVKNGTVDVELRQQGELKARFRVKSPTRDGLFTPVVRPRDAGTYDVIVALSNDRISARHNLGRVQVFAANEHVDVQQRDIEGDITYLKEQQWQQPFATHVVTAKALQRSLPAFAEVQAPAGQRATVRAPQAGYFFPAQGLTAGSAVERGKELGVLVPRAESAQDIIALQLELSNAQAQLNLAKQEVERLQLLVKSGAIPASRLAEAHAEQQRYQAQVTATEARIAQRQLGESAGGIALKSPISGKILLQHLASGMYVDAQQTLLELAAADQQWLRLAIPERFSDHVKAISGAWLETANGLVRLDATNAQVAARDLAVNETSRTFAVTLAFATETWHPMIGTTYAAHALTDAHDSALAVPVSAVIRQEGKDVVFVHTSGETFARREVELGIRDGAWIEVKRGVTAGERVVSTGAYDVRLAAIGGEEIGHGHAH